MIQPNSIKTITRKKNKIYYFNKMMDLMIQELAW
jgi:hypothetical protein